MNITVHKKLNSSKIQTENIEFGWIQLLKHVAVAGSGYRPTISKLLRSLGFLFYYSDFLKQTDLKRNKFSNPPDELYDPTEKNAFSNIIGKAVGDYLAKKLCDARLTQTYESAMLEKNLPIKGKRPDLLCFNRNQQFAVETKGFSASTISSSEMRKHKKQAKSGPLAVSFSIASVTYNIYNRIENNFYDPPEENDIYEVDLYNSMAIKYYGNIFNDPIITNFLDSVTSINNSSFIVMPFYPFFFDFHPYFINLYRHFQENKYSLIIDNNLRNHLENNNFSDYYFDGIKNDSIYVDRDGIGVSINGAPFA